MTSVSPTSPSDRDLQVAFQVEGMHCGACVALIQEVLVEQDGVAAASVELTSGRAVVSYDPSRVTPEQMRSLIAEAGYTAT